MRRMKNILSIVLASAIVISSGTSALAAGWSHTGQQTYFTTVTGVNLTGWWNIQGYRYYFDATGAMLTGKQCIDGKWYYFNSEGVMQTGWQNIDGVWYCYAQTGEMYVSTTTPDGNKVDETGAYHPDNVINLINPDGSGTTLVTLCDNFSYVTTAATPGLTKSEIDALRQEELNLVNAERTKRGLTPLVMNETLNEVAQLRAEETLSKFSHTRPNGTDCFTAFNARGMKKGIRGENLLIQPADWSTGDAVTWWMNSKGHRGNILRSDFKSVGFGIVLGANGWKYWSEAFWTK